LINDRFGHAEGDRALAGFAEVLLSTFRKADVIGRLGGDEFAVLMVNCPESDFEPVDSRLQAAVDAYNLAQARGYDIRYSIGVVSSATTRLFAIDELLAIADTLMYDNKRAKAPAAS